MQNGAIIFSCQCIGDFCAYKFICVTCKNELSKPIINQILNTEVLKTDISFFVLFFPARSCLLPSVVHGRYLTYYERFVKNGTVLVYTCNRYAEDYYDSPVFCNDGEFSPGRPGCRESKYVIPKRDNSVAKGISL